MNYFLLFIGAFVASWLYQAWRDAQTLKRFKMSSEESCRIARSLVISHPCRILDAVIVASVVTAGAGLLF